MLKPSIALSEYQIARYLYGLKTLNLRVPLDFFNYTKDSVFKKQRVIENNYFDELKSRLMPLSFDSGKPPSLNFRELKSVDCNVTPGSSASFSSPNNQTNAILIETPIRASYSKTSICTKLDKNESENQLKV